MNYEVTDCIDAGTEYCPCHLAQVGECILCSQLSGKTFCDCINWKGVCIYQEYVWNGNKAKNQRKNYFCKVLKKEIIDNKVIIFTLLTSHKIAQDLMHPGSYIFMRSPKTTQFYDTPISIMDVNTEENWIKVAIEIKGIKTKSIDTVQENENMLIRAPFWNGIFGLKNVYSAKDGLSLVIARGIGQAPMVPVLRKLYSNRNQLIVVLDNGNYRSNFVSEYLSMYDCKVINCKTLEKGELTDELKEIIDRAIEEDKVNLIHCDGADILNFKVIEYVNDRVKTASCNNARMCCGEGVCGSCSARYKGHVVKRLCKIQTEPKKFFEGRRLI
ncbi:sulfide/dihydroorotate dehydrogenase-like FAD/NAD-binding protein [Clostridium thermarum]|uniref:sulfide/dihydroorotate dehydrogenase-like FAD/NAD-binding protein n=1 Tax=Clostridium thermarum TaxID=1716543 RepID=UPI0013D73891|nr:sulfide/dihydroorotate dehydrogenase-like FAD/NAD-binding protein [Clostridium thermarum]